MTLEEITLRQINTVQNILENQKYDYSCAMALLPTHVLDKVSDLWTRIDPQLLVEKGIEREPHITILYGIHTSNSGEVENLLKGTGPWKATILSLSLFKSATCDVLKLGIKSSALDYYNFKLRRSLEYSNEYDVYSPHITIAYLKPGTGDRYIKETNLDGMEFSIDTVEFSPSEGDPVIFSIMDIREDAPVNNVGSGNIAGCGVGPQGEPGVLKKRTKYNWNHGRDNS